MDDKRTNVRLELGAGPLKVLPLMLEPDPARTVVRPFGFAYPAAFAEGRDRRPLVVAQRVLGLEEAELFQIVDVVLEPMRARHRNAEAVLLRHYDGLDEEIRRLPVNHAQKLLLCAYFSQEYAFESAALFNPSIVRHPGGDDEGGNTRFVLSLRGIGEGHISSVTFRTGNWSVDGRVTIDPPSLHGVPPRIFRETEGGGAELICDDSADVSESVIFPILPIQRQGVEDLRLVRFTEDDGRQEIVGTYTAFDGRNVRQRAYCIGACLLDQDDPSVVLARTRLPLLIPSSVPQRGGYVPNVVYSCGALIRGRNILLPFGVGDRCTTFAIGSVDSVLETMVRVV